MTCFSFFSRRRRNSESQPSEDFANVKVFTYKELRKATEDFCPLNRIGEGGFGSVYKGKLKDGTIAAVKVLSTESKQGAAEFLNEINVIADIVHENLIKLLGCCIEGDHRIIVYKYATNNSLAQTLLGSGHCNIDFSWNTRTKISVGVARGLSFLHEEIRPHVVHRDIKASNILLDEDLNPKISDFGLAKLLPPNVTHVSTRVAGTVGYLAPEYAIRGQLTRRADIYSFGVLLLEIVTGKSNTNMRLPSEDRFLLERSCDFTHGVLLLQTWKAYEQQELITLVDAFLNGKFDADQACRFLKVGLLCTQDSPKLRPTMSEVIKMLTGERDVNLETITKPGVISDFMDMKVRNSKSSQFHSPSTADNSSADTTNASLTFTAIMED